MLTFGNIYNFNFYVLGKLGSKNNELDTFIFIAQQLVECSRALSFLLENLLLELLQFRI